MWRGVCLREVSVLLHESCVIRTALEEVHSLTHLSIPVRRKASLEEATQILLKLYVS